tara:strand:+ start:5542 stop:7422 length:1881 start_codon:yes stop_codon:yes gene_type:complete
MRDLRVSTSDVELSQNYKNAMIALDACDYDQALVLLQKELEGDASKEVYYALAQAYFAKEDKVRAIKSLIDAVRLDKLYHEAFALLGDCYYSTKQGIPAIESYAQAVAINPQDEQYMQKLVDVVSVFQFKKANPNLKGVLIECLACDNIDVHFFGRPWLSMVSRDATIGPFYKLSKCKNYAAFKKHIQSFPNCDGLIEPFFLTGFGRFIILDYTFEVWCGYIRRYLLESIVEEKSLFSDPEDIDLITCALSRYCFFTDYVMDASPEEVALVAKLEKRVLATKNPKLSDLACLACYQRIYNLDNAGDIYKNLQGGDHVSQILKTQIEEYQTQDKIKDKIEALTVIHDNVSSAVREQYENFPYPRWTVASRHAFNKDVVRELQKGGVKILNAGCGTGKEAIQMAYTFPDAEITAVDLSRSSLAYGIFKAEQMGIKNITFKQADIMELGGLDEQYDYIASAGVLHHLKDPKAGWKILYDLLKPNGLMRIALYSRHARWAVNDARSVIQNKNIGSDAQSIRDFRKNIKTHLKHKSIKNIEHFFDYYALPECRDLLFHVQEHQFDLIEIKEILDTFGLEFLQFYLTEDLIRKYKTHNPDDESATNLESWAAWEEKNPNLFASMYTFWCRKT